MRSLLKRKEGFTLIELMIVVAIIGILAAVAIPRFADLITKSKEGATKGNLGALRSSVSIYYGDNEGYFPVTLDSVDFVGSTDYIEVIPEIKLAIHTDNNNVDNFNADDPTYDDDGEWAYASRTGKVKVDCTHQDHSRRDPQTITDW